MTRLRNAILLGIHVAAWGAPEIQWHWANPQPTGNNLIHVSFIDPAHGLIVSDNGEVAESDDGGGTWTVHDGRIEGLFADAHPIDGRTVLGVSGDGRTWKTEDAGATWRSTGSFQITLLHVASCGDSLALAVGLGETIIRSVDRGSSWTLVRQDSAGQGLFGVNCAGGYAFAVGDSGKVLRSRNAGLNWEPMPGPLPGILTAVAIADSQRAFILSSRGRLAETRDGGATWKTSILDTLDYTGGIQWAGARLRVSGNDGSIWTSRDTGATWIRSSAAAPMHLASAAFIGDSGGIAVGYNGLILMEDGGAWKNIRKGPVHAFDGMATLSPKVWLAYGDSGSIYKTTDGGATWKERLAHPDSIRFLAGSFREKRGILAGFSGTIVYTQDEGETWQTARTPPKKSRLFGVAWSDSASATAVGDSAALWRTVDGGRTWAETPRPAGLDSQTLSAIAFQPGGDGFIVGYGGAILRSKDGGASWSMLPAQTTENLYSLAFRDRDLGLAGGSGGTMLITRDGGSTWTTGSTGYDDDYTFGIAWLGGDTALAVGDWGDNWFVTLTTDAGAAWTELPLPTRKWSWALTGLGPGRSAIMGQDGSILIGSLQAGPSGPPGPPTAAGEAIAVQRAGSTGRVRLRLDLASARNITIRAYALDGRRLGTVFDGNLGPGAHTLLLPFARRGTALFRMEATGGGRSSVRSALLPY